MNTSSIPAIGFIGGGNMARSLIGGMIAQGLDKNTICASDPIEKIRDNLARDFGIRTCIDNDEVIVSSQIVIIAVKPQVMREALVPVQSVLQQRSPLIISIAAGISLSAIDTWSGGGLAIIRVMPNTPALIQLGISGLFANDQVTDQQRNYAQAILEAVGKVVWLENEQAIDTVTAVSGSGPAYFFYLIEALEQAATTSGLTPKIARLLASQTAVGASHLCAQSDQTSTQLREQVTSPGGTTERALGVLDDNGVRETLVEAIHAAEKRAAELSELLEDSE